MFATELDSFVYKFNQLWSAGHSAHLDLDTHAGRAWVGLRVQLGHHAPLPPYHLPHNFPQYSHKKDSPSRQRRRAKRAAAAQKANAEEASKINKEVAVDVAENESAEEAIVDVEESRNVNDAKPVEETDDGQNETLVGVAEEALQMRILDELCPDNDYETATIEEIKASEVSSIPISQIDGQDDSLETVHQTAGVIEKNVKLKNQYPRNCEDCGKYLRSSIDFRKHIVACVMARK
jgi:hypothetical protein